MSEQGLFRLLSFDTRVSLTQFFHQSHVPGQVDYYLQYADIYKLTAEMKHSYDLISV